MAIAIFSTWTTYGTWLPGDERGWFHRGRLQTPDLLRKFEAAMRMKEDAITLDPEQRLLIQTTVAEHCVRRRWTLHAMNCRSNHVHVVVTAPNRAIEEPREQFKSWCTRRLKERARLLRSGLRDNWWTQRGWDEFVDDVDSIVSAITYVRDRQDAPYH